MNAPFAAGFLDLKHFHLGDGAMLPACAWYPSERSASGERAGRPLGGYGRVFRARARIGAAFLDGSRHTPLVLLLHGLQGSRLDLSWLGERLAEAGLVSVAFDQPYVAHGRFDPHRAPRVWQRAAAIPRALDWVLSHGILRSLARPTGVWLAGHSAGASAALGAAGAQVSPTRFAARYPEAGPPPSDPPAADGRIGAVFGLAPGTGEVFEEAGLKGVRVPVWLASGTHDRHCPDARNAVAYARGLPDCSRLSLPGAGHFAFKPCCSWYGRLRAPGLCWDRPGVRRNRLHDQVTGGLLAFAAARGLL